MHSATLIPKVLQTHDLPTPSSTLVDKTGAIFGSVLLLITLATLLITSAASLHVQVWTITVPAALIMFGRDVLHDLHARRGIRHPIRGARAGGALPDVLTQSHDGFELGSIGRPRSLREAPSDPPKTTGFARIQQAFPTCCLVISRLPVFAVLFALCMFILVQSLGSSWINVFATWWARWVYKTGTVGAVLGMYVVTMAGCNVSVHVRSCDLQMNLTYWYAVHGHEYRCHYPSGASPTAVDD